MMQAREEILMKLEDALKEKKSLPDTSSFYPVFNNSEESDLLTFKNNIEFVSGNLRSFNDEKQLFINLKNLIAEKKWNRVFCLDPEFIGKLSGIGIQSHPDPDYSEIIDAGITGCEYLIAETGSVMVSSASPSGRKMFVFPDSHIIIAGINQLVSTLGEAYKKISDKYKNNFPSQITLITGPSRTADIEKTLVLGAHGPKEIYVFLLI
jgi:L-lactate dehydrogenase complex protein LldG